MVTLTVVGPPPRAQTLAFSGGTPVLTVLGTPGLAHIIQAKKTVGPESHWVTLATRTQNEAGGLEWMDPEGSGIGQRLYRIVWRPLTGLADSRAELRFPRRSKRQDALSPV